MKLFTLRKYQESLDLFTKGKRMIESFSNKTASLFENWPYFIVLRGVCLCLLKNYEDAKLELEQVQGTNIPLYIKISSVLFKAIACLLNKEGTELFLKELQRAKYLLKERPLYKGIKTRKTSVSEICVR
jgi:hypothetical protein